MMHVLIAIGQRDGPVMLERSTALLGAVTDLVVLNVIDSGPRRGLEEMLLRRGPERGRSRMGEALGTAEDASGQASMDETIAAAKQMGLAATPMIVRGTPEQVIVRVAGEEKADLIVIRASEGLSGRPQIGPASVGHIARFVLDHAPCSVLLLRESSRSGGQSR
jgi:nucleotide-binding universal stress UspA family protein